MTFFNLRLFCFFFAVPMEDLVSVFHFLEGMERAMMLV